MVVVMVVVKGGGEKGNEKRGKYTCKKINK